MPLPQDLERAYDSAFAGLSSVNELLQKFTESKGLEFKAEALLIGPVMSAIRELKLSFDVADTLLDPPGKQRKWRDWDPYHLSTGDTDIGTSETHKRKQRARRSQIKTFVFPKSEWTPVAARAWLRDRKFQFGQMEVIGGSFHFNQLDTDAPTVTTMVIKKEPKILGLLIA